MTSWLKARLGRMRVSTLVLIVAFVALFWVYHYFEPRPAPIEAPTTAVVPPGFVPDPNYTWVPRTNVRPKESETTTTTTTPTTTSPTETTTSPGETTSPTSPTSTPETVTESPTVTPTTPPAPGSGLAPTTPAAPS